MPCKLPATGSSKGAGQHREACSVTTVSGNADFLVRGSGDDTRAIARVGRFGPGSLSLRLLAVLLIPILGLEVLAWREVQQQRQAADSAAVVRHEVQLQQRSGELVVPLQVATLAADLAPREPSHKPCYVPTLFQVLTPPASGARPSTLL